MASQLCGVRPSDPATYGAIAPLVVRLALAAMIVTARTALSLDPMLGLRYER